MTRTTLLEIVLTELPISRIAVHASVTAICSLLAWIIVLAEIFSASYASVINHVRKGRHFRLVTKRCSRFEGVLVPLPYCFPLGSRCSTSLAPLFCRHPSSSAVCYLVANRVSNVRSSRHEDHCLKLIHVTYAEVVRWINYHFKPSMRQHPRNRHPFRTAVAPTVPSHQLLAQLIRKLS